MPQIQIQNENQSPDPYGYLMFLPGMHRNIPSVSFSNFDLTSYNNTQPDYNINPPSSFQYIHPPPRVEGNRRENRLTHNNNNPSSSIDQLSEILKLDSGDLLILEPFLKSVDDRRAASERMGQQQQQQQQQHIQMSNSIFQNSEELSPLFNPGPVPIKVEEVPSTEQEIMNAGAFSGGLEDGHTNNNQTISLGLDEFDYGEDETINLTDMLDIPTDPGFASIFD